MQTHECVKPTKRVNWGSRAFTSLLGATSSPVARTSIAVAVGTAQGVGYAGAAALLHRAIHAGGAGYPVAPRAEVKSLIPSLKALNARIARRVMQDLQDSSSARKQSSFLRAFRNCAALGQIDMCTELYTGYRSASLAPLSSEFAASLIDRLGDICQHASPQAELSDEGGGSAARAVQLAIQVARDLDEATSLQAEREGGDRPRRLDGDHGGQDAQRQASTTRRRAEERQRTLNALMRTCALGGDMEMAMSLYRLGITGGTHHLEQRSLCALIEGLCSAGRGADAYDLWEGTAAKGLRVRRRTMIPLLRASAMAANSSSEAVAKV